MSARKLPTSAQRSLYDSTITNLCVLTACLQVARDGGPHPSVSEDHRSPAQVELQSLHDRIKALTDEVYAMHSTKAQKAKGRPAFGDDPRVVTMRIALQAALPALKEGDENCGDDDNIYHEPLKLVEAAVTL